MLRRENSPFVAACGKKQRAHEEPFDSSLTFELFIILVELRSKTWQ